MITNIEALKLDELTHIELINTSGGVSVWRYVGMYVRFRQEGLDHTNAMIAALGAAYSEN